MARKTTQPAATARRPGRPHAGGPDVRLQLLEAGREVFADRGYASAGARDIVARVGVTVPVLYHHFGSKAGLFAEVLKDVNDQVLNEFEAAIADKCDLRSRLDAVLDVLLEFTRINPTMARFVVAAPIEYARHPELADVAPEMARLGEFVHRLCEGSEADGVAPDIAEALALTIIYGISRVAASPGASDHAVRQVSTAVRALRETLRGELFEAPARGNDGPVRRRRAAGR